MKVEKTLAFAREEYAKRLTQVGASMADLGLDRGRLGVEKSGFFLLSLLKTSYPSRTLAFSANTGYLLRHANDSLFPSGHSP